MKKNSIKFFVYLIVSFFVSFIFFNCVLEAPADERVADFYLYESSENQNNNNFLK